MRLYQRQTADLADKVSDTDSVLQIHMVLHELPEPYKRGISVESFWRTHICTDWNGIWKN